MSRDPWEGTGWRPGTLSYYVYASGNPLKYIDPSGHRIACSLDRDGTCIESSEVTYDLTRWLVNEMAAHAVAPELEAMRRQYLLSKLYPPTLQDNLENLLPVRELIGGPVSCPANLLWYRELFGPFYELNKGFGLWDVKRKIQALLADGIILCGTQRCDWFDYSTPGNILYGFTAATVGVPIQLSTAAGGLLEIREGTARAENYRTLFEDPEDAAGVRFGYVLYNTYGGNIEI